jgi:hypothetical protein
MIKNDPCFNHEPKHLNHQLLLCQINDKDSDSDTDEEDIDNDEEVWDIDTDEEDK